MMARRVVSLVPSATETLRALGAHVVACTRFCHQPSILTVGGTKNPDIDAIVALAPDVVAVDVEENRREDADALSGHGLRLVVTDVRSVDDAVGAVATLAIAAGVEPPRLAAPPEQAVRARAFVPIWRRPWMTLNADTYGASMLGAIGVELVTAGVADRYPEVDLDDVATLGPDLVLVPSEPYDFGAGHLAELAAAFPDAATVPIDGEDLFWWGVRTPDAHRRLREVLDSVLDRGPSVNRGGAPR